MGLFTFRRPVRASQPVRARLRLECLDQRDQPSDFPIAPNDDPIITRWQPPIPPENVAPEIVDFEVEGIGPNTYIIRGRVVDENPGGLGITFGGGIAGVDGVVVYTDANGYFSYTATVQPGASGIVSAITMDNEFLMSNTAVAPLG